VVINYVRLSHTELQQMLNETNILSLADERTWLQSRNILLQLCLTDITNSRLPRVPLTVQHYLKPKIKVHVLQDATSNVQTQKMMRHSETQLSYIK
jgi:hypothetical protein